MKSRWKVAVVAILLLILTCAGSMMVMPAPRLGLTETGELAPCPMTPNCVASYEDAQGGRLEPLHFSGSPEEAMSRLTHLVSELPRTRIVTRGAAYLHVEFRSRIVRFVDDVEFLVQPERKQIQFRSASRVGYSDLGVNRRRMEQIRRKWDELSSSSHPSATTL